MALSAIPLFAAVLAVAIATPGATVAVLVARVLTLGAGTQNRICDRPGAGRCGVAGGGRVRPRRRGRAGARGHGGAEVSRRCLSHLSRVPDVDRASRQPDAGHAAAQAAPESPRRPRHGDQQSEDHAVLSGAAAQPGAARRHQPRDLCRVGGPADRRLFRRTRGLHDQRVLRPPPDHFAAHRVLCQSRQRSGDGRHRRDRGNALVTRGGTE